MLVLGRVESVWGGLKESRLMLALALATWWRYSTWNGQITQRSFLPASARIILCNAVRAVTPLPFRFSLPKLHPPVPDHHRRCARCGRCLLNQLDIDTAHSKPMEDDETIPAAVNIPREQTDPEKDEGGKRNRKSVHPRLENSLHTHIKVPCSLDILKSYIQQQRALLERIKLDISRLRDSKQSVDKDPVDALDRILLCDNEDKNDDRSPFEHVEKLSTLVEEVCGDGEAGITKDLDWELFRGHGGPLSLLTNHSAHDP